MWNFSFFHIPATSHIACLRFKNLHGNVRPIVPRFNRWWTIRPWPPDRDFYRCAHGWEKYTLSQQQQSAFPENLTLLDICRRSPLVLRVLNCLAVSWTTTDQSRLRTKDFHQKFVFRMEIVSKVTQYELWFSKTVWIRPKYCLIVKAKIYMLFQQVVFTCIEGSGDRVAAL